MDFAKRRLVSAQTSSLSPLPILSFRASEESVVSTGSSATPTSRYGSCSSSGDVTRDGYWDDEWGCVRWDGMTMRTATRTVGGPDGIMVVDGVSVLSVLSLSLSLLASVEEVIVFVRVVKGTEGLDEGVRFKMRVTREKRGRGGDGVVVE